MDTSSPLGMRQKDGGTIKTGCNVCSIHFVDEFEKTLVSPCNYWGDMGMSNLTVDLKKKVWDWLFAMPADEVGLKSGIGLSVNLGGYPISEEHKFENIIPGYKDLDDEQRKQAQKFYFKNKRTGEVTVPPPRKQKKGIIN